jgi:hypothetical protein
MKYSLHEAHPPSYHRFQKRFASVPTDLQSLPLHPLTSAPKQEVPSHRQPTYTLRWMAALVVVLLWFATAPPVWATTYYWRTAVPTGVRSWSNAANWSTVGHGSLVNAGTFPNGAADVAVFGLLAVTPNAITFSNLPVGGVGTINGAQLQVPLSIPAGETLSIVGTGSDMGGNATFEILPGAAMRIVAGASITGAGGGWRWQISGTLEIVDNGAVIGSGMVFFPGSTLRYTGSVANNTGWELMDGFTNLPYATGFPGNIVVQNTGGVTLPAATSMALGNGTQLTLSPGGILAFAAGTTLNMLNGAGYCGGGGTFRGNATATFIKGTGAGACGCIGFSAPQTLQNYISTGGFALVGNLTVSGSFSLGTGAVFGVGSCTVGRLTLQGTNTIAAGGLLDITGSGIVEINGNAPISGAGTVSYASVANILTYTNAGNVVAGIEWPATMAGQVAVNKPGSNVVQLNAAPTRIQNAALAVQSGYLDVIAAGNLALGAASTVQNGAYLRVMNDGTMTGLNNLTVNNGGSFSLARFMPGTPGPPVVGGTPTYNAGSMLFYGGDYGGLTVGTELPTAPATMNGRVVIDQNTVTNAAARSIAGGFTVQGSGQFNMGAFGVTLAGLPNNVTAGSVLNIGGGTLALNNVALTNYSAVNVGATGAINCVNAGYIGNNNVAYTPGGTLIYSGGGGSAATNAEFPGGNHNVIINKPGSAYGLTSSQSVNGSFTIQAGRIDLGGNGLTLNGPVNFSGGTVSGNTASNLTIGSVPGGAVTGPLTFAVTPTLNNFTYNRPTGLNLGSNLTLNTLTLSNGTLGTGANTLRLSNTPSTVAGTLTVASTGRLRIDNAMSLTNSGTLQVAALGTLELNGTAGITGTAVSYLGPSAVIEYTGPTARTNCSQELPMSFNASIRVNNAGGVVAPNYTVGPSGTGSFNLVQGNWILSNPAALLQVGPATLTGGSATSYVQTASVTNIISRTTAAGVPLDFPVGNATTYLPVRLTNPSVAANVSVAALAGAPAAGTNGTGLSGIPAAAEYWRVYASSACTSPVQFTKNTAITATTVLGRNGTGSIGGPYNAEPTTNNVPNFLTTTAPIDLLNSGNFQHFALGTDCTPTTSGTSFTFSGVTTTQFDMSFTAAVPAPAGYLVVRRLASTAIAGPTNGTTYTVGMNTGAGNQVIAVGSYAACSPIPTQTGLTPNTGYAIDIYTYSNCGVIQYFGQPTTGVVFTNGPITFFSCATPPAAPPGYAGNPFISSTGRNSYQLDNVVLTGGGGGAMGIGPEANRRRVDPGSTVNIAMNAQTAYNVGGYCPTCVQTFYMGLPGSGTYIFSPPGFMFNTTNPVGPIAVNTNFTAPATSGIYYITIAHGLDYPTPVGTYNFINSPTTNAIGYIIVTGPCDVSDVIATPGFIYTANIPYTSYTNIASAATSLPVWSLRVRDGGGVADEDNKPTVVQSLALTVNNTNNVIQDIALYTTGGTLIQSIAGIPAGTSVQTFSAAAVASNVIAPDDGFIDVVVRTTFKQTALANYDQSQFSFSVASAGLTAAGAAGSSQFTAWAALNSSVAGNNNRVDVTGTALQFIQQPSNTPVGVSMSPAPTVRAVDANGNTDTNYPPTISVAHPNLVGSPVSVVPVGGTASFSGASNLVFNSAPLTGITLTASGGTIATVNSNPFNITTQTFYLQSPFIAQTAANWNTLPGGGGSAATAFTYAGSTFQTQSGQTGVASAPWAISVGVSVQVVGNSTLQIQTGQTFAKNGTLTIAGAGTLELQGNAAIVAGAAVQYQATNAVLLFTGTVPLSVGNVSLPNTMPGSVVINRTGGLLDMTGPISVAGNFTVNSGNAVINGGTNLTVAGTTSITGGSFGLNANATMAANGPFTQTGGMFDQNNGNVTMANTFTLSGGNYNANGTGNLALNGVSTVSGGFLSFSGAGNLAVGSSLAVSAGQVSMNGSGSMTVAAGGGLTVSSSGQVYLASSPASMINGAFSLAGGQFDVSASSVSFNGALNFGAGVLNGTGAVSVSGSGTITGALNSISLGYGSFTMNRAGASLALASALGTNLLNLSNGYIFSTPSNPLVVTTTAPAGITGGSTNSFVAGELQQTLPAAQNGALGNGPFVFPVGKFSTTGTATYLPIALLNVTTATAPAIAAEAYVGASGGSLGVGISGLSTTEYWRMQLVSGGYTSGNVRLQGTNVLIPQSVVAFSNTPNGAYTGGGAISVSGNVVTSKEIAGLPGYFSTAGPPAQYFYYKPGFDPSIASSWNSQVNGTGAPAGDFMTLGNFFVVPAGRTASLTSGNMTFALGTILQVNAGGIFSIGAGRTVTQSGTQISGRLQLVGNAVLTGQSAYYLPGSELEYAPSASRTTTDVEFPDGLAATVVVNSGTGNAVTLNANKTVYGGLSLLSGTLNFSNRDLSVYGSLLFTGGFVNANGSSNLSILGGTAATITGQLTASGSLTLSSFTMNRLAQTLTLGSPVNVQNTLNLTNGVVATSLSSPLTVTNPSVNAVTAQSGYVDGPLRRTIPPMAGGMGTYLFPLGNRGLYLPAAFDKPVTGLSPQLLEAQAYADSAGTPGTGLLTISKSDYLRMVNLTGTGILSGSVQFQRSVGFNPTNLVGSTVANMTIGAFNALPSTSTTLTLTGGPVVLDSAVNRAFIIGSVGQPPFISLLQPTAAATGATITVSGGNFYGVTQVIVAGVPATTFTVDSAKSLRFVLPPGVTSGTVTVVALAGTAVSAQTVRTIPPPVITSISPLFGPSGTAVTLLGRYFSDANSVKFASTPSLTYSIVNDTLAYAVVGAGTTGKISLTTPGGTGISADTFTLVQPPVITDVQPPNTAPGDVVTIIGRNFTGTTSVNFPPVTNATFVVVSDNEIRVTVPNGASGNVTPTVNNGAGGTTSTISVSVSPSSTTATGNAPRITSFSYVLSTISTRNLDGSITLTTVATVTVTGANLTTVSSVSVGSTPALTFTAATDGTSVVFQVVTSATGTINITTPLGIAVSRDRFDLTTGSIGNANAPIVRDFRPRRGGAGTLVTITGEKFAAINQVRFGGIPARTFTVVNSTTITAVVGTGATGFVGIISTNGNARTDSMFVFLGDTLKPDILTFTPTSGSTGATMTITGVNFSAEKILAVRIGGTPVTSYIINSTTEVVAVVGTGTSGFVSMLTRDSAEVFSDSLFVFEGSKFSAFDSDSLALVRFYRATSGGAWTRGRNTWLTSTPLAQWDGVTVETVGGVRRVTTLLLPNNNVTNMISAALGDLTALRVLDLSGNALGGAFPAWVGRLQNLEELRLARAGFGGELPDELLDLTKLTVLDVSDNALGGVLPSGLCSLSGLRELSVQGNAFTGALPSCLWQLANAETLDVSNNRFTGQIPQALAQVFPLRIFRAANNGFTGTVPPFGITAGLVQKALKTTATASTKSATLAASASPLSIVDVGNNNLSGTIPASLGSLPALSTLVLSNNNLTGQIPSDLWNARSLTEVRLNNNQLTGEIPPSVGRATSLRVLTLDNNQLTGPVPDSVTNLASLQVLSLSANRLTSLPVLTPISRLDTLRVENNALTFESLEPNRNVPTFVYRRQDSVGEGGIVTGLLGKRFVLDGTVGGSQNQYRWFKRSWAQVGGSWQPRTTELAGQTSGELVIPSFQITDTASAYYCTITNPVTPDLTLVLRPFAVLAALPAKPAQAPELIYPSRSARNLPPFVTFAWQPVVDENQYVLELATDSAFASVAQRVTVSATTANLTGLKKSTRYWWRVAAVNQGGMGAWSEITTSATATGIVSVARHRSFETVADGIDLAFPTVDFGRVTLGERASLNNVSVVNLTDTPIQLNAITLADGTTFTVSGSSAGVIPPQSSQTLAQTFTFKPTTTGQKQSDVTLAYQRQGAGGAAFTPQQLLVRSGLTGRSGALWVDTVRFGTVLSGRSAIATAIVVNRSDEPVRLRRAVARSRTSLTSVFTPEIIDQGGIMLGAGDTTAIAVRARSNGAGYIVDDLVVEADADTSASVIRAFLRKELPSDVIIEVGIRATKSVNVAPGEAVDLELVLLTNNASRLFSATQPIFTAAVSFDRNLLALDETRSRAFRSATKSAATRETRITLANEQWSGADRVVLGRIQCLAVQGDTDKTTLTIDRFVWGPASTVEDVLTQKVFVTDLRSGSFESELCKAGGKRLVRQTIPTSLVAAKPNPASEQATVTYSLRESGSTTLQLFDAKGALMKTVVNASLTAGQYETQIDVSKLPSGAYMLVLTTPTARLTERLDVVK